MVAGPLGPPRDDALAALISYYVTGALSDGKGRKPQISDFIPRWGESREEIRGGVDQEPADSPGGGGG